MAKPGRSAHTGNSQNPQVPLHDWVSRTSASAAASAGVPGHIQVLARGILERSHGVVVSSTMALSAAIVALRESGDFGCDSPELALLESVLRYSEEQQVPPKVVMATLAGGDEDGRDDERYD